MLNIRQLRYCWTVGCLLMGVANAVPAAPSGQATATEARAAFALPLNTRFDHIAMAGERAPVYLVSPERRGRIIVTVESQNGTVPNLKVNGGGMQQARNNSLYEITFTAEPGRTYAVTLNKLLSDCAYYRIMARLAAF